MFISIKKLPFALTILISSAVFIPTTYAPEPQKFKVCVKVDADKEDETEKMIIESHLKRELRALGDVLIVREQDDWQWRFQISMFGNKLVDGTKKHNVIIASSTERRVPRFYFNQYKFLPPSTPVYHYGPSPSFWNKDNLHAWCISYASKFDKELQAWRK